LSNVFFNHIHGYTLHYDFSAFLCVVVVVVMAAVAAAPTAAVILWRAIAFSVTVCVSLPATPRRRPAVVVAIPVVSISRIVVPPLSGRSAGSSVAGMVFCSATRSGN
jgi:hypothetical protein